MVPSAEERMSLKKEKEEGIHSAMIISQACHQTNSKPNKCTISTRKKLALSHN